MTGLDMAAHQHANAGWGGPPPRMRVTDKDDDPFEFLQELLVDEGYDSLEDLKASISIPGKRYICRPFLQPECRLDASPKEVFRHALILGLCTAQMFDPERPVIWTRSSLSRVVELFDPVGFYQ
jgi:hypothetical protein